MTKEELLEKYNVWAERARKHPQPNDLDDAVSVLSFDSGSTDTTRSGTNVFVLAVHTNKIHMFIFAVRSTWTMDPNDIYDMKDETEIDTDYRFLIGI